MTLRTIVILFVCILSSCGSISGQKNEPKVKKQFTLPEVPAMLQSPQERAAYVAEHYWVNFDFADTTLINNAEVTEQAFADYLNILRYTSANVIEKSIGNMLDSALNGSVEMFDHFSELFDKYLYDPNSPFRQEDHYIAVLRWITSNDKIDELRKVRPRYQLEMAMKNRPGSIATDFTITEKNGRKRKLSEIKAQYTVLFFNNPDCNDCARVKDILSKIGNSRIKIAAIYTDQEIELWRKTAYPTEWINGYNSSIRAENSYDLRAIPNLYLLDKNKQVILKDVSVEDLIDWIDRLE